MANHLRRSQRRNHDQPLPSRWFFSSLLKQGGYDWGYLAYCVGFGGSMIWFGSSAGVALSNMYPEARSVGRWLRHGWPIAVGYVVGFFVMLATIGFHPGALLKGNVAG